MALFIPTGDWDPHPFTRNSQLPGGCWELGLLSQACPSWGCLTLCSTGSGEWGGGGWRISLLQLRSLKSQHLRSREVFRGPAHPLPAVTSPCSARLQFRRHTLNSHMQVQARGFPPSKYRVLRNENISWETSPVWHHVPWPELATSKENTVLDFDQSLPSGHCWQRRGRLSIWWTVPHVVGHWQPWPLSIKTS